MASFSRISGAEPSTVTFKLATVTQTRNSSAMHQEILTIGDPDSSLALAVVTNAVPASTAWGLVTREAGGTLSSVGGVVSIQGNSTVFQGGAPWTFSGNSSVWQGSSAWQVQVSNGNSSVIVTSGNSSVIITSGNSSVFQASSAWQVQVTNSPTVTVQGNSTVFQGGAPWFISQVAGSTWTVRANNSSAADLLTQVSGNSTVAPLAGSTWNTRPIQSSAADLQVTATIGTNLQSTVAASSNSSGLIVRNVIDNILTVSSTNAFTSTSFTVQSSAALIRSYVVAYSILSTNAGPQRVKFYSGSTMLWPMVFAAVSSAVSGANLAVSAPAYLFRTKVAGPLTLQIGSGGSTVAGFQVAVSYFRAP